MKLDNYKIVMFCGKGGVGKSTCASATAVYLANKGKKVLLVSSDPMPSLSDIFGLNLRGELKPINEVKNLYAVELTHDIILDLWKKEFGEEVYRVVSSFLPVGREIIDYVAGAPGIDEEFMLNYILKAYKSGNYDVIVWDTAPAGGTLNLLRLEDKFYRHLGEAAKLYLRVKGVLEQIKRGGKDPLSIINSWRKLVNEVMEMLRAETTGAVIVTIPEALSVNQLDRIYEELTSFRMKVAHIVINGILSDDLDCGFCRKRAQMQKKYVDYTVKKYGKNPGVALLPLLPSEIKGLNSLFEIIKYLFK